MAMTNFRAQDMPGHKSAPKAAKVEEKAVEKPEAKKAPAKKTATKKVETKNTDDK